MKKHFTVLALIIMTVSFALGQQKMTTEQMLTKAEEELAEAIVKGDLNVIDKHFDAKAVITDPGGMLLDKTQTLALIKSGDLKFESMKVDDFKVQLFGNTAIVTYRSTDKGVFKGQTIGGMSQWTDTFIKMKGKWLIVAAQGTPVMLPQ